jgi:acetyltransferase|tara:strand:+ start:2401 stop:2586 length:186 start_codon:yes stop_codon:yes gene_type:complete
LTDILQNFFYPKAVAIIGAAADPSKIGGRPLQQCLEPGFQGQGSLPRMRQLGGTRNMETTK